MDKIHGMATIKRDGTNIVAEVDASLKVGGLTNEVKMVGGKSFYSQKTIPSQIEVKIPHTEDVDLVKEQSRAGVEIQFHSDNDSVYVVASAAQTGEVESGSDGLVTLTYMGDPATKA